jgi:hypothetical protein
MWVETEGNAEILSQSRNSRMDDGEVEEPGIISHLMSRYMSIPSNMQLNPGQGWHYNVVQKLLTYLFP